MNVVFRDTQDAQGAGEAVFDPPDSTITKFSHGRSGCPQMSGTCLRMGFSARIPTRTQKSLRSTYK